MKFVVYGETKPYRVGIVVEDSVIDVNRADSSLPSNLREFIEAGDRALEGAQRVIDGASKLPEQALQSLSGVKLRAPFPGLRVACAGSNYARHIMGNQGGKLQDGSEATIEKITAEAIAAGNVSRGFWKNAVSAAGPDDEIKIPARTQYFDYEGELAVILGKEVKDFKGGNFDDLVWGVTLLNDWSIRDEPRGINRPLTYNLAKNFDGSVSMGPSIVVGELPYGNTQVQTHVNGKLKQDFNSSEMISSFPQMLEYLSRDFTFVPGDVLSGGTSSGTAMDSTPRVPEGQTRSRDLFLNPGDVVELSEPRIGVLSNRVV